MQLIAIRILSGEIELLTGLHIGGGDAEMHIGGIDNPVIKHPVTQEPYIPGSSIKGKMRSLLEWELGVVSQTGGQPMGYEHIEKLPDEEKQQQAKDILKLFGGAPGSGTDLDDLVKETGPTRLAFWDCRLERAWVKEMEDKNLLLTEAKMENTIDRIKGVAENPRQTERVPASAKFQFKLTLRQHTDDGDLLDTILKGLRLIEVSGLGGSGSRGYGKVQFNNLACDGESLGERMQAIDLFASAG